MLRHKHMENFTIRDLRERTGELVRGAEAGKLSLVSKRGNPLFVAVPFSESLLTGGVRTALALQLVRDGTISQGVAAELAGMSRSDFLDLMARHRVPAAGYPVDELREELTGLGLD
ncbi:type II toxin-antitoxin system prevent-host-death family antitoxin [Algiphilus aromaticivorans]|uniref:type II toxin-antitoxin system prevent-host-death family antitoxin n=1 Tax=Algiphilus aromaticivorans TaxID=382454 RepID=UPI0018DE44FA|nr:type II toxin-antitoxin system prevent-host-death family antitoxin [Algiphilus aromaticivorans]